MKKLLFLVAVFSLILLPASAAHAQQFDLSAGLSAVTAPASTSTTQTVGGGAYVNLGMDFLFFHNTGVEFNAALRAKENLYEGVQPFRPFFYDFDAVYAPQLGRRAQAHLSAGLGLESVHFYEPNFTCNFISCTNVDASHHFLTQLGAGIRFYATPRIFIEPSVHVYLIHNNVEFSGSHAIRSGISIGYSFKNQE